MKLKLKMGRSLSREGVVQSFKDEEDVEGEEGRQREQNVVEREQAQPRRR